MIGNDLDGKGRRCRVVKMTNKQASYSIAVAAKKIGISGNTLRGYDKRGLIRLYRDPVKGRRLLFDRDLKWIRHIRKLIHEEGLNIVSIQRLLAAVPCWKLKKCPKVKRERCPASADRTRPCWMVIRKSSIDEDNKCWTCRIYQEVQKRICQKIFPDLDNFYCICLAPDI
jgi:DNA-binding transcriptional MerR regulator